MVHGKDNINTPHDTGYKYLLSSKKAFIQLKRLSSQIEKLDPEEFQLFFSWAKKIMLRGSPPEKKEEIIDVLENVRPGEVDEMLTNLEKNLKKAFEDAKKEGIERGMEKGMEKVAKQMLANGEDIEKIIRYTGLTREEIERLSGQDE